MSDYLDEDGYPTDAALDWIAKYSDYRKQKEWFNFIKNVWWSSDWGWHESEGKHEFMDYPVIQYQISTGGWSGNEQIIAAMRQNWMMWSMHWVQSRRGGHYIFERKA